MHENESLEPASGEEERSRRSSRLLLPILIIPGGGLLSLFFWSLAPFYLSGAAFFFFLVFLGSDSLTSLSLALMGLGELLIGLSYLQEEWSLLGIPGLLAFILAFAAVCWQIIQKRRARAQEVHPAEQSESPLNPPG